MYKCVCVCVCVYHEWACFNGKNLDRLDLVLTLGSRTARETLSLVIHTSVIRSDDLPSLKLSCKYRAGFVALQPDLRQHFSQELLPDGDINIKDLKSTI